MRFHYMPAAAGLSLRGLHKSRTGIAFKRAGGFAPVPMISYFGHALSFVAGV